jgi:Ser/Thr protein kinase RdoA (MazF antagonist)
MHEHERDILRRHYGLTADEIQPMRTVGGGIKTLHRVACGPATYVLKRFRTDYRTVADVVAMHDAQDYLRAAGLPMVAAVPNRDGQTVTPDATGGGGPGARGGFGQLPAAPTAPTAPGYAWVLYPWVYGHHIQPGANMTLQKAATLGDTIARLAQALKGWPTSWPGAEPTQLDPPDERITFYEELLRHAERDHSPTGEICRHSLRERLRGLHHLAPIAPAVVAMERQWVHGDMNEGNVFFDADGRITAIIDFDNIRRSPRGFDFMYALGSFFPTRATEGPERDAYARAWIEATRPTRAELELLPAIWAYRDLCDVWPIDEYYLHPDTYPGWSIDPPTGWWERELERSRGWLLELAD